MQNSVSFTICTQSDLIYMNFIKSTAHRPTDQLTTDHLPTDSPTHRPKIYWPTEKILFQTLDNYKIFILQITNTAGKM